MMSLTGAFYPAIDLCAGEKERGTMETLLISPASRAEIVMGKFLTVVLASMMTALLNLVSMGLTAMQLAGQVGGDGPARARAGRGGHGAPPSLASAVWMVLLLIPLSVFFSAVCLALAVLARSMKEGQYYMTPLYLICLPLIFLTLAPGIELNLFYSLVPITGVSLLLRALILGDYDVGLAVLPAGAGPDDRLRRHGPALGGRAVPARGRPLPRGRAVRPAELAPAPAPRQGADPDRRRGAPLLRPDADLGLVPDRSTCRARAGTRPRHGGRARWRSS